MKSPNKSGGSGDRSVVNVHDDYELKYWIQVYDITETQLTSAVKAVGSKTEDVAKYIRTKHKTEAHQSA